VSETPQGVAERLVRNLEQVVLGKDDGVRPILTISSPRQKQ